MQKAAAQQIQNMNQSNFVSSPAAEDYAEQFATAYINIPADKNGRDARTTGSSKLSCQWINNG